MVWQICAEKVFDDLKKGVGGHSRKGAAIVRKNTTKKVYKAAKMEKNGTRKEIRSYLKQFHGQLYDESKLSVVAQPLKWSISWPIT